MSWLIASRSQTGSRPSAVWVSTVPARIVGIDDMMPAPLQFGQHRGLSGAGHAGHQHHRSHRDPVVLSSQPAAHPHTASTMLLRQAARRMPEAGAGRVAGFLTKRWPGFNGVLTPLVRCTNRGHRRDWPKRSHLGSGSESWVHCFALEGEDCEHRLVDAVERVATNESFNCLSTERELADRQGSLPS